MRRSFCLYCLLPFVGRQWHLSDYRDVRFYDAIGGRAEMPIFEHTASGASRAERLLPSALPSLWGIFAIAQSTLSDTFRSLSFAINCCVRLQPVFSLSRRR